MSPPSLNRPGTESGRTPPAGLQDSRQEPDASEPMPPAGTAGHLDSPSGSALLHSRVDGRSLQQRIGDSRTKSEHYAAAILCDLRSLCITGIQHSYGETQAGVATSETGRSAQGILAPFPLPGIAQSLPNRSAKQFGEPASRCLETQISNSKSWLSRSRSGAVRRLGSGPQRSDRFPPFFSRAVEPARRIRPQSHSAQFV